MEQNDTITALATPNGTSALAVIRLSGSESHIIFRSCIEEEEKFESSPCSAIRIYTFKNKESGERIDEVTAIKYDRERSYTGEAMVEIICHGGYMIIEKIVERFIAGGARYAHRGEFSKRAFSNGKLDILKAESINALIESQTESQLRCAHFSYSGTGWEILSKWKDALIDIQARIESIIEFGEDESDIEEEAIKGDIKSRVRDVREEIGVQCTEGKRIRGAGKGIEIAIVGPANAGKSSLFNYILDTERSIVHWSEGTTRDYITEKVVIRNCVVDCIDTAGISYSNSEVEAIGIARSWEFICRAPIVIWVSAAQRAMMDEEEKIMQHREGKETIVVLNKIDMGENLEKKEYFKRRNIPFLEISLKEMKNVGAVIDAIETILTERYEDVSGRCIVQNARQERIMQKMIETLARVESEIAYHEEFCAEYIRDVLGDIGASGGETMPEDVINRIFETFCIGK
jgi:tRNA modification GTPase